MCSIRNRPVDKLVRLCRGTSSGSSFIPTSQRNYLGYTSPRLANEHASPALLLVKRDTLILLAFLPPRSPAMADFRAEQCGIARRCVLITCYYNNAKLAGYRVVISDDRLAGQLVCN